MTLPKQPLIIDADMTRLAQVFLNLLNNAAKYGDEAVTSNFTSNVKGATWW